MIKRPFLIAVAGLLVVVGALLLLFLSDEEVPENNTDASMTVNSNVNQNPLKKTANKNENQTETQGLAETQVIPPLVAPKFDVVRIDPEGNIVIAGRAQPNSIIEIISGREQLGQVKADGRGEWVFVPASRLKNRNMIITLRDITDQKNIIESKNAVVIGIPNLEGGITDAKNKNQKPLAMVVPRSEASKQATRIIQSPGLETRQSRLTNNKNSNKNLEEVEKEKLVLTISTIDYDDGDLMLLSGQATAQNALQIYINDKIVGSIKSSDSGTWSFQLQSRLSPGHYQIRVDLIGMGGKVAKRIQVPFEKVQPIDMKNERRTVIIKPGNSLWRIAARVYGSGFRYTEIYKANLDQIRDPDLIYPGQVFKLPALDR